MQQPCMRRTALVTYSDSDDGRDETKCASSPVKRRLLPPSSSLLPNIPIDNPLKHQGRTRTAPHSDGQFAAYIYIDLKLPPASALEKIVRSALTHSSLKLQDTNMYTVPSNDLVSPNTDDGQAREGRDLHISLSRPIFLRAHQRQDMKKAVRAAAQMVPSFQMSFSQFAQLTNDERTRRFLTLEVGAGHNEMRMLSEALSPALRAIRQKEFYPHPKFHASIAWMLMRPTKEGVSDSAPTTKDEGHPLFPVQSLNARFSSSLFSGTGMASKVSLKFEVDHIYCKIGKEITKARLCGVAGPPIGK